MGFFAIKEGGTDLCAKYYHYYSKTKNRNFRAIIRNLNCKLLGPDLVVCKNIQSNHSACHLVITKSELLFFIICARVEHFHWSTLLSRYCDLIGQDHSMS